MKAKQKYGDGKHTLDNEAHGFSLIELMVVVAIILIIVAIAIPSLLRSRIIANEAAAATMVRAVTTASTVYSTIWANSYPPSLAALGGLGPTATCDQAVLLDQEITVAPNQKSGYKFSYTGEGAPIANKPANCGAPGYNAYLVTALPITPGYTGTRSFCSDLPGVIHYDLKGNAIGSPSACEALPSLQ